MFRYTDNKYFISINHVIRKYFIEHVKIMNKRTMMRLILSNLLNKRAGGDHIYIKNTGAWLTII